MAVIKVNVLMIKEVDLEIFVTLLEMNIMDNGLKIKKMEKVN